jgi:hypothetical protein
MSLHGGLRNCDTADKNQSSWHMPCAVHLESPQISISGWHGGACLILCRLCQLALEGGILSPSARLRPEKDFLNRRIRSDFSVDLAWMGSDNPFVVA